MKVGVMGCEVNGPGEAKDADVGIAGGVRKGAVFRKGKVVGVYPQERLLEALLAGVDRILVENGLAPHSDVAPPPPVGLAMLSPGRSRPARERA